MANDKKEYFSKKKEKLTVYNSVINVLKFWNKYDCHLREILRNFGSYYFSRNLLVFETWPFPKLISHNTESESFITLLYLFWDPQHWIKKIIGILWWEVLKKRPHLKLNLKKLKLPGRSWIFAGIHGWITYSCIGCLLGIVVYRHGLPMKMSSCFYPLLGDKVFGWIGDVIDILSIITTLFGVCTSLGLGVIQLNAGLNILNENIPTETYVRVSRTLASCCRCLSRTFPWSF